uniref:Exocyst complex component Sec3 coiled-coil domain-containing protein n=1 Tax=Ditylenchus dipsaci TaxID=166011 RepID=A0A915CXT6_9BILA
MEFCLLQQCIIKLVAIYDIRFARMYSERSEQHLLDMIDEALEEATQLEKQMDEYDSILSIVSKNVEELESKNKLACLELHNKISLEKHLRIHLDKIEAGRHTLKDIKDTTAD